MQERDWLLHEKESWVKTSSAAAASDSSQILDVEKAELMKSRDDAAAQVKVCSSVFFW